MREDKHKLKLKQKYQCVMMMMIEQWRRVEEVIDDETAVERHHVCPRGTFIDLPVETW